jgi:pimeloyl-ACP methyl ester carboxylesterase
MPPGTGQPGDVVSAESESLLLIDAKAWLVLYRSTDALGRPTTVSGTVLVPNEAWQGEGPRPIIAFAHGTVGVTDDCAPSKGIVWGVFMETSSVQQAIAEGWAVAITDYEGLGTPGNHTYTVNISEAHAVLDSVRAAIRMPETGLDERAPVAIWGYSQGGGAAAAAAERAPTYAPELQVRGVAAGGVVADLAAVAANLEGSLYFGFATAASQGLDTAYPELDLESFLNDAGKSEYDAIQNGTKSGCLTDLLTTYAFKRASDYTTSDPLLTAAWQRRLAENRLGQVNPHIPALLYHGEVDEIIPLAVGQGLRDRWCALGVTVKWVGYPLGLHLTAQSSAEGEVVSWLRDRFNGVQASSTCDL